MLTFFKKHDIMFLGGKGNKINHTRKEMRKMKYYKFTIKNEEVELADNYLKTSETNEKELALYGQELVDEFLSFRGYDESAEEMGLFASYKEITQTEYEEEL